MLKALAIKELRESAGVLAVSALTLVYALASLTGFQILPVQLQSVQSSSYPFVDDPLSTYLVQLLGGLAIALGFKQTAWELGHGTYFFLLHRPVSRFRVFATKLAIGLTTVLLFTATFILLYAWWAATPGHVPAPFFWSMTAWSWNYLAALPVVYMGAFLSGIRLGSWFGSRLVPLVTAIGIAILAVNAPWFWLSLVISLVAMGIYLVSIFYYVQTRDY